MCVLCVCVCVCVCVCACVSEAWGEYLADRGQLDLPVQ